MPRALPRLVLLPSKEGAVEYVFLHDMVHAFAERLYHGYEILSAAPFRVTRNSNLYLEEEESRSILDSVDTQIHRRRKGAAVRLEIEAGANKEIIDRLQANFRLEPWQVFRVAGPTNLSRLFHMYDQTPRPDLKFAPFVPRELALKPGACLDFRADPKAQRDAASSLRFLFGGRAIHRKRRAGPGRPFDQADALSHQREFADRPRADRRRLEKRSRRGRRAQGAFRRSIQHSLGAQFAGSRRAGVFTASSA